jgi:hypothetical protein
MQIRAPSAMTQSTSLATKAAAKAPRHQATEARDAAAEGSGLLARTWEATTAYSSVPGGTTMAPPA